MRNRQKKIDEDNGNDTDVTDETEETETDAETVTEIDTETSTDTDTNTNTVTFPLTRTFVHCDSTGRELSNVTLTATVTLTRINGVTLSLNEIERRFRRNFYLSFKGGKAGLKELSAMHGATSAMMPQLQDSRPRRTMSPEHKAKLQEARQRRRHGNDNENTEQSNQRDNEAQREIVKLATTLLTGLSDSQWFGKSAVLAACHISAIEPVSWSLAIRYLLDTKQIEAQGEKRGREYRRARATKQRN